MYNLLNHFPTARYLVFFFLFQIRLQGISFIQNLFELGYFQGKEFQIWTCCAMNGFHSRLDIIEELLSELGKRAEEITQNAVHQSKRMENIKE